MNCSPRSSMFLNRSKLAQQGLSKTVSPGLASSLQAATQSFMLWVSRTGIPSSSKLSCNFWLSAPRYTMPAHFCFTRSFHLIEGGCPCVLTTDDENSRSCHASPAHTSRHPRWLPWSRSHSKRPGTCPLSPDGALRQGSRSTLMQGLVVIAYNVACQTCSQTVMILCLPRRLMSACGISKAEGKFEFVLAIFYKANTTLLLELRKWARDVT